MVRTNVKRTGRMMIVLALVCSGAMNSTAWAETIIEPVIVALNDEPIVPTQEISIVQGDSITFDIYLNNDTGMKLLQLDALVSVGGLGTLSASTLTWPYNVGLNNWQWDVAGKQGAVATGSVMAGMGSGVLVGHFVMHCDADDPANDVVITLSNDFRWGGTLLISGIDPYPGAWGSAIVHQSPGLLIYVDADANGANDGSRWGDAYNYLQDALADASVSDKNILVAEGTYRPDESNAVPEGTGLRTDTFQLIDGVAIYGGFPAGGSYWEQRDPNAYETILSGDINAPGDANDNSYHVVTGSGTDANTILDGFTVTAGNASGSWPSSTALGGGMYNYVGSPTVTNCTFSENSAESGSGMWNDFSSSAVTNCTFSRNSARANGGGMFNWASSPAIVNCKFSGNSANSGGAMLNNVGSSPTLTNCTFTGNLAESTGGGFYNVDSNPTVTNCTFSGNSASNEGGGMYNQSGSTTVTNCILWGNTATSGPQIYGTVSVDYSDVEGGYPGTQNIDEDPRFKDADGNDNIVGTEDDNLELSHESPCIDSGDNNSVPADSADLDGDEDTGERTPLDLAGNARFTDDPVTADTGNPAPGYPDVVEMGAYERYEFCGDGVYLPATWDLSGPAGVPDCRTDFFDVAVIGAHWLEYTGPE